MIPDLQTQAPAKVPSPILMAKRAFSGIVDTPLKNWREKYAFLLLPIY